MILLFIGALALITIFSLIARYYYKKGEIKMSNDEIKIATVNFNSRNVF